MSENKESLFTAHMLRAHWGKAAKNTALVAVPFLLMATIAHLSGGKGFEESLPVIGGVTAVGLITSIFTLLDIDSENYKAQRAEAGGERPDDHDDAPETITAEPDQQP